MILFHKQVLKNVRAVGAIAPSSSHLARRMTRTLDVSDPSDSQRPMIVVELGPGTGAFTQSILDKLPADGHLIAIELNESFAQHLHETHPDPRLTVMIGNATDTKKHLASLGITSVDHIISGLPLGSIREKEIDDIFTAIDDVLSPSGSYIQFQYFPWHLMKIRRSFTITSVQFELLNIPPAFVITSKRIAEKVSI